MRIIAGLVFILLTLTAARCQECNDARGSQKVEVHFRFRDQAINLHEPAVVLFEVHNGLSKPIIVTVGSLNRPYFEFALTTPTGQVLHKNSGETSPDVISIVSSAGDGKVAVAPGGVYKESLIMNKWFPFALEGKYLLTSSLTSEIDTYDGMFRSQSQSSHLRILPRDTARLSKICEELANRAKAAHDFAEAQEATEALSYVDDPVAVPYLAHLLTAHTLAYENVISGLERLGNDDAVEALLSALDENWGDIPELATSSLGRMQNRISNPSLKETVKKAVERTSEQARNKFIKEQIAYLQYRSPQLQTDAIQNLARVQDGLLQAEPVLERLADDPNQPADVRTAAKTAIQTLHLHKNQ